VRPWDRPATRQPRDQNVPTEHFVTLFDASFLPIGLALYQSLESHAAPFRLWIVAMDEAVERQLKQLSLPHVSVIGLPEFESPELLEVKPVRTRGEYCWTVTPFTCQAVFDRDPAALRATYVDADLFFLDDPRVLLRELDDSGKHVLITEHAYAPNYDRSHDSGRFCVQFLTFDRSDPAREVMRWWQERCLEWCYARYENGKFGDQVYLDQWPTLFGDRVHIVRQVERTLAPWNVLHFSKQTTGALAPVMYHFHGLRLRAGRRARLFKNYDVGPQGLSIYDQYLEALSESYAMLDHAGIQVPTQAIPFERFGWLKERARGLMGTERFAKIPKRNPLPPQGAALRIQDSPLSHRERGRG
jgi:hypothetical protein